MHDQPSRARWWSWGELNVARFYLALHRGFRPSGLPPPSAGSGHPQNVRGDSPLTIPSGSIPSLLINNRSPPKGGDLLLVELGGIEPPSGKASRFHLFQAHSCLRYSVALRAGPHTRREVPDCLLDLHDRQRVNPAHKYDTRFPTGEHDRDGWLLPLGDNGRKCWEGESLLRLRIKIGSCL